ncbi:hypothetical protein Hanom_Chr04g00290861 [Helianthus anomalus]
MKSTDRCHATTFSAESAFNGDVCLGSGQNRVPSVSQSPAFILDGGWTALVGDWLSWAVPLANRLYHSYSFSIYHGKLATCISNLNRFAI